MSFFKADGMYSLPRRGLEPGSSGFRKDDFATIHLVDYVYNNYVGIQKTKILEYRNRIQ